MTKDPAENLEYLAGRELVSRKGRQDTKPVFFFGCLLSNLTYWLLNFSYILKGIGVFSTDEIAHFLRSSEGSQIFFHV